MKPIALVTGVTGQDGAYLSEFLLNKGYEVHGIKRRTSLFNTKRINHLFKDPHDENVSFFLHYGDLTDSTNLIRIIQEVQPDEIYNLGAQSHVKVSFESPEYTANSDAVGALRLLEAIRILGMEDKVKYYQASTSELYGLVQEVPQSETTPFYPRSPYAVAKLYAYWITVNYREAYNIFACNGILFNHESPIRGETFVTRKITRAAARIVLGTQQKIYIGNMNAKRDWGHAKDYVEAMWLMLQQDQPEDFVIATGETTSVRTFIKKAFSFTGVNLEFRGSGDQERAFIGSIDEEVFISRIGVASLPSIQSKLGTCVLEVDSRYFRPTEVELLVGDPKRAKQKLKWKPKYTIGKLINEMMGADIEYAKKEIYMKSGGFSIEKNDID